MDYPLSDVMDRSASLLNDTAKTDYTYAAQLPYVQMAMDELQEEFEQNNIAVTNEESAAILIPAGVTLIGYHTSPKLPDNMIDVQQMWEQETQGSSGYIPMTRMEFLPHYLENQLTSNLVYWAPEKEGIKFLGATLDVQIKFDYISSIFPRYVTEFTMISVVNTKSFLAYRNAALCAQFIGENKQRADDLNHNALMALDRALGIPVKARQSMSTRHRPFRAAYRSRGNW